MKASHVLTLQEWVAENQRWIRSEENPSLKEVRIKAESDLGFKCAEGNLKDVFQYLEIPVRRSKSDAKLIELEHRCDQYRSILLKIAAFVNMPDDIARELREEFDIDRGLLDALRLNREAISG